MHPNLTFHFNLTVLKFILISFMCAQLVARRSLTPEDLFYSLDLY